MKLKGLLVKLKMFAGAPAMSLFVCLLFAVTLATAVSICSREDDHADTPVTSAPGRVSIDELDVPIIDDESENDDIDDNVNNNEENVTTDDDVGYGEFTFLPYLSGVIKFDGEDEEPIVPPMNDPDDRPETTETAPVTTTTTATTTTKVPETTTKKPETTTKAPETTTKKPETTKKPTTTTDKPVPDLSGTKDGAAAIVKVANSQIGVKESPYNNVKYNTWFYGREVKDKNSRDTSHAWCVVFISWCADRAGISTDVVPKTAGVGSIMNFYKNAGRYKTRSSGYVPKVGDIAIFGNGSHAGIVVACDGKTVSIVEGNYSDSVKLNTYKVGTRTISGYCTPNYK